MITHTLPVPKSICTCGHLGDGPNSSHQDRVVSNGHGPCKVPGCGCPFFTWDRWTPAYQIILDDERKQNEQT